MRNRLTALGLAATAALALGACGHHNPAPAPTTVTPTMRPTTAPPTTPPTTPDRTPTPAPTVTTATPAPGAP